MALENYVKFLRGTPAAFSALEKKDENTLYFISEKNQKVGKIYLGDILVAGNVTADGSSVMDTLEELVDVDLTGKAANKFLGYNGAYWVPMSIDEVFTVSVMDGASDTEAGAEGLVPAPQAGDHEKFLRGDGTWADVVIPSNTQVFEVEIDNGANHDAAITTAVGEKTLQSGDIAIVKELIASGKRQYTAYVYADGAWKAMDGNYNAENVYFDENITITQTVGNVTATNGNGTIPAAGKNLKQVFEALWTKEDLSLSIDTPSVSFTLSNSGAASGEVGSPITLPSATVKVTDIGSYEYGSKAEDGTTYGKDATGITFSSLRAAFGDTANTATKYEENVDGNLGVNAAVTYTADTSDITEELFLDTAKSYTFSYKAVYTDSPNRKPVTNLGNFINSAGAATTEYSEGTKAIGGSTLANKATWTATGYRKWFWGYKNTPNPEAPDAATDALTDPTAITSAQVRALQQSGTSAPSTYTVPAGTKQVYFVFPAGKKSSLSITNKSALNAPVACKKVASGVQVADYRGTTKNDAGEDVVNNPTAYDLWYVNLDSAFSGSAELVLTWA